MRLCGVLNASSPSRKKGRFSGKNSAWRGSITNWPASDSTSAKSGFTAPLRVSVFVIPHSARQSRCPGAGQDLSLFDDGTVHLNAEWIHGKDIRLTMVVEGAEEDLDVVVRADLVSIRERSVDAAVPLECADPEIHCRRRV